MKIRNQQCRRRITSMMIYYVNIKRLMIKKENEVKRNRIKKFFNIYL